MITTDEEKLFNEKCIQYNLDAKYIQNVITEGESKFYFTELKKKVKWGKEYFNLFGKKILSPRLVAWYGDKKMVYTYNGVKHQPTEWIDRLIELKLIVEKNTHSKFNSALLNLYRDGKDSMGWHRDNERSLGNKPIIASLSLGEKRRFMFKNKKEKVTIDLELSTGSLLIMYGNSQNDWYHQLPKTKKMKNERINITFRKIIIPDKI